MPGLIEKLKNKHFLSLSGNIIMSGVGMVTFAILYHALTPEEMGIWIYFQTILLLLDTVRSGFLTTAFIKFYAGAEKQRADEITGAAWFIGLAITGIFVLVNALAFFVLPFISDVSIRVLIKWFGVTFICMLPYFIATCVVQAEQRFDRLLFIRFITQIVFVGTIIALITLHKTSLQNVVLANLASAFITSIVTIMLGFSRINMFGKRTKAATLEMFHFGKFSVGTSLSASLFGRSDVIIIKAMLGPAAVAVYSLGVKFLELVEIPLRSFAATAMPSLSSAYNKNNKDEVVYIYKKYAGMTTVMLIPACLIAVLLADFLISLVGGGQYAGTTMGFQAANVYRLYMTFALLYPADRFLALTLDVINKPHVNFYKILLMLAANVTGDVAG
ncbi:MAG TPA: oligosaccharide flippase family protein, partial [Chitinophagaceae bacterium]|nr:oligosaccharide flippase family protein [Chitinophagaceae bacterium]